MENQASPPSPKPLAYAGLPESAFAQRAPTVGIVPIAWLGATLYRWADSVERSKRSRARPPHLMANMG